MRALSLLPRYGVPRANSAVFPGVSLSAEVVGVVLVRDFGLHFEG